MKIMDTIELFLYRYSTQRVLNQNICLVTKKQYESCIISYYSNAQLALTLKKSNRYTKMEWSKMLQ